MKFWEAMKALEEGKKVRASNWEKEVWIDKDSDQTGLPMILNLFALHEWELYEEPEKTYSFMEVVQGLREGRKFVRKGHASDLALFVMGFEIYPRSKFGIQNMRMEDFEATDWIEVF